MVRKEVLYSSSSHETTDPHPNILLPLITQVLTQHDDLQ
jgi:hypothetical protein